MPDEKPRKPQQRRYGREGRKSAGIKCHGHCKSGAPCRRWALTGQLVCDLHGGKAPQNLSYASKVLGEERAQHELAKLARLDLPPVANALEALQVHAAIVIAWRDKCAEMLNMLDPQGLRYEGRLAGEQTRAEVGMWERSLDRATATLTALARCQVDERLTTIRENDARMIAAAMAAALADAEVGAEMAELVRIGFSRRLVAISEGKRRSEAVA